jgi:hypothetical protein
VLTEAPKDNESLIPTITPLPTDNRRRRELNKWNREMEEIAEEGSSVVSFYLV